MSDSLRNIQGTVKWFDPKKGFGFIVGPDGQDVFVHYSQIEGSGFRILEDGQQVRYDATFTKERGWHATTVSRLDPPLEIRVKRAKPASNANADAPAKADHAASSDADSRD